MVEHTLLLKVSHEDQNKDMEKTLRNKPVNGCDKIIFDHRLEVLVAL